MKRHAFWGVPVVLGLLAPLALLLLSCGSGGGSSSGSSDTSATSGTLSVAITDAKPKLPRGTEDAENVYVTFDEVQVHKPGGAWVSLPLAQSPYTIDLLQFSDGKTTQLVPPVKLTPGKYTQIRLVVSKAWLVTTEGVEYDLKVPSGKLKTDKEFDFEVTADRAVDLVVDFDLSRSITPSLNLQPVLHIVEILQAATLRGNIPAAAFGNTTEATVTVWSDKNPNCTFDDPLLVPEGQADEVYTTVTVDQTDPEFEIFWLVPNELYFVEIEVGGNTFFFTVPGGGGCPKVQAGATYDLGLGTIQGTIAAASTPAVVTVLFDGKTYTGVQVLAATVNVTFSISVFPNQPYVVQIELDGASAHEFEQAISVADWATGPTITLNGGNVII
jgi:hypothetical protein